ncbi:Uncharacterised protein [Sphingobacterium spiritivorum]|uniref:Uncharacterized protein n=1 Tax=Sphingobacterium spiritivorum TaxID=258 RepID=A0A380CHI0_SPHSI|nr:hypothetical protein [Sphingobacterium spiritivorum]SUJ19175.1 Uncharacterised protein [Sphingobacterium spiritivorum]
MITKELIIDTCQEVLSKNKANFSIYKVLIPVHKEFGLDHHVQEVFTFNGVRWYTDFNNERIDLGEYPEFYEVG